MKTRLMLTVFLALPLFVVALLMWFVAGSLEKQASTSPSTRAEAAPMSYVQDTADSQPEDTGLVQPETLPQGFIIVVEDPSKTASATNPIFIGTNHGNWHPGNPEFKMSSRSDGRWQAIVPMTDQPGRMQFKFTRGTWETVELDAENNQIDNRVLPQVNPADYADGSRPIFEYTVQKWADHLPGATRQRGVDDTTVPLEVTGTAKRFQIAGGAGRAKGMVRDAIVWLPPGYAESDTEYPVLYMLDGQNVFMEQPGTPGEWHADETATELIEAGEIEPMIIVGIPNSGFSRADEYLPEALIDGVEPSADEFIGWIERTVMPRVERAFRVRTGPASTSIGGASFGGVFALYAASKRPDLFGAAIVESPSVLSKDERMLKLFTAEDFTWPKTVFLGMGDHEAGTADDAAVINARYNAAGAKLYAFARQSGADVEYVRGEGHVHNENAWAERFPAALKHLFAVP